MYINIFIVNRKEKISAFAFFDDDYKSKIYLFIYSFSFLNVQHAICVLNTFIHFTERFNSGCKTKKPRACIYMHMYVTVVSFSLVVRPLCGNTFNISIKTPINKGIHC